MMTAIAELRGLQLLGPNAREHWAARMRRTRHQRSATYLLMLEQVGRDRLKSIAKRDVISITLTRIGGRPMDDDNLVAALKPVRDGVADALGLDDGDKRLRWRYEQVPGGRLVTVRVAVDL